MDRPALKRLMADIEAGKINCVVVYKVDRLSRSLLDFAKVLEIFERHNVAFVSVTQQFNTSTSMGRLMLRSPDWLIYRNGAGSQNVASARPVSK